MLRLVEIKPQKSGSRERVQCIKCLLSKHRDLGLISRTHTKVSMWWHMLVILVMGRWKQVDPWVMLDRPLSLFR